MAQHYFSRISNRKPRAAKNINRLKILIKKKLYYNLLV